MAWSLEVGNGEGALRRQGRAPLYQDLLRAGGAWEDDVWAPTVGEMRVWRHQCGPCARAGRGEK
jgi:hypothetical protein